MTRRDERGRFLVGTTPGPGAQSKYESWMAAQVHRLALLGMTDEEMAAALGVNRQTFYTWQEKHFEFREAVQSGKERADAEIAESMFRRAKGHVVEKRKFVRAPDGQMHLVEVVQQEVSPDTAAGMKWLGLRRRKTWADREDREAAKREAEEQAGGYTPEEVEQMPDEDLEAEIARLEARLKAEKGGQ